MRKFFFLFVIGVLLYSLLVDEVKLGAQARQMTVAEIDADPAKLPGEQALIKMELNVIYGRFAAVRDNAKLLMASRAPLDQEALMRIQVTELPAISDSLRALDRRWNEMQTRSRRLIDQANQHRSRPRS